jgi:hypothetical protein
LSSDDSNEDEDATGAFRRVMNLLTPSGGTSRTPRSGTSGRPLVLGIDGDDERRHFLAGRVVSFGDRLELALADERWIAGRYEWSGREGEPAHLRVAFSGGGDHAIPLPASALLRWPSH